MANEVIAVKDAEHYIGLAADTKPPTAPPGSTYYVADTPALYVFTNSTWRVVSAAYVPCFSANYANK
jgi:hypothetical protein